MEFGEKFLNGLKKDGYKTRKNNGEPSVIFVDEFGNEVKKSIRDIFPECFIDETKDVKNTEVLIAKNILSVCDGLVSACADILQKYYYMNIINNLSEFSENTINKIEQKRKTLITSYKPEKAIIEDKFIDVHKENIGSVA
ncbi:MAG: hypothetical protein GX361_05080 [Bacteroidales bacterium]|nr:hypothetical protein [Bacteroidales bacterium]